MEVRLHSDDMGATDAVSRTMLDCRTHGAIAGFSIFGNGTGNDRVAATLTTHPERHAHLAVHLNLCEGPSLAPPSRVPLLVDRDGNLRHGFTGLLARTLLPGSEELLRQVEVEWRAQIEAARCLIAPRHLAALDGHNHFHMIPALFNLAARLASEYRIPAIRIVSEPAYLQETGDLARPGFWLNLVKNRLLWLLASSARDTARARGLAFDDRVVGVLYAGRLRAASVRRALHRARRARAARVEVMFHIGRALPSEAHRWDHAPAFRAWYLSPERDLEAPEAAELAKELWGGAGTDRATAHPLR